MRFFSNDTLEKQVCRPKSGINLYPGGSPLPGRNFNANSYRYGYNKGSEKDDEISGAGNHFTTKYREGDTRLMTWWSVDPEADEQPWQSPYSYMDGNPIQFNDPDGDCPTCLTALIGGVVGAAVEFGSQVASNIATGKDWNEIDYADVGIAAGEGALIGLTGGLGAAGTIGKTTIKVVNTSVKVGSALGQGAVDVKQDKYGGTQTVVGEGKGKKDLGDAAIDAGFNLIGSAAGGKAPTGSKKLSGPLPNAKTPKEAVKTARTQGPVNRTQRVNIETKAKTNQKSRNIANETIRETPGGVSGGAVKNIVGDKTKDIKNGK